MMIIINKYTKAITSTIKHIYYVDARTMLV